MLLTAAQVAFLSAIAVGCEAISRRLSLPLPGNVLGAIVLWGLLSLGLVKLAWVERGGDLLLKHLSLFFVPAAVGVLQHRARLAPYLLPLAIVIVATTAIAMLVTGLSAQRLARAEHDGARASGASDAQDEEDAS